MYINDYIKEKRKEKEITQEQLAKLLGLQQYTISKWETNKEEIKKEYIPDICNILDIDSYHLMHILMDDIFLSPNICKDLNEIFKNKSELKETIKFVLEENTKIQIIMNNCMNYIKKNIEDLTDFTIKHNLNPYETREELLNKYIIDIERTLVRNFEYNKEKNYEIYGDEILLKLLNALIILSKKENKELYSFLCLIIRFHSTFLMNMKLISSADFEFYQNSKILNLNDEERSFIFHNLDIIISRIERNKKQFKYENITEKEIILDIICCTIMNKYYPSDAFKQYKMEMKNSIRYTKNKIYESKYKKNNYYSVSILANEYINAMYSNSIKNISRLFKNERFIKDLSYLPICKEYNISEEDIKTFIKDMSLAYFY